MGLEFLGRIPYASLIGFILIVVGAGVMSGTLFDSIHRLDVYFRDNFFPVECLRFFRIASVFIGGLAIIFSFFILLFAILATEATRGKIYHGDRCIMGGRCSATFFIGLTYIAIFFWFIVCAALVVPVISWLVHENICSQELSRVIDPATGQPNPNNFNYLYNLTNYGIYFKPWSYDKSLDYKEHIYTYTKFESFCNQIRVIGPFFGCALVGSVCVMIGMIAFIGSLSSTYMRLKYTRELTKFRQAIDAHHNLTNDYFIASKPV